MEQMHNEKIGGRFLQELGGGEVRKLLMLWLSVISNLKKNKAALDTQKGANLGLKCVRMRLAAGLRPDPLRELKRSPRPPSRNWEEGYLLPRGRKGMGEGGLALYAFP